MHRSGLADVSWQTAVASSAIVIGTLIAAWGGYRLLFWGLRRLLAKLPASPLFLLLKRLREPVRLLIPILALMVVIPTLELSDPAQGVLQHLLTLCAIAAITWALISVILAGQDHLLVRYTEGAKDEFKARAIRTQLTVAVKILVVVVVVVALAAMLMTFARIRTIGMSILASAGLIGITAGFAAQRSLATLFAGLQIAITQPIRLQDVVMVEGEFGTIEEITLTYVVVKAWDMRRLVVPVTYFLEKPFQNWTRRSTNLLATVYLYADYTLPVERVRGKLQEILAQSAHWDRQVSALHVTNWTDRTLELRALMSAADSAESWNLRCEVREKLLAYLLEKYPECLPRTRTEINASEGGTVKD